MAVSGGTILFIDALLSAFFAGIVTILATASIEKYGGVIGGVLASIPSAIVPASIGITIISAQRQSWNKVYIVLHAVPAGMLVNVLFLYAWRLLPRLIARKVSSGRKLLVIVLICALSLWTLGALVLTGILDSLMNRYPRPFTISLIGALFFGVHLVFAVIIGCVLPLPIGRKGDKSVSVYAHLVRGLIAAVPIFISVILTNYDSVSSGLLLSFPVVMTTVISTWWTQGYTVSMTAAAPMILGSISMCAYAISYSEVFKLLSTSTLALGEVITITVIVCWFFSIFFISVPIIVWLRWKEKDSAESISKVNFAADEKNDDKDEEDVPLTKFKFQDYNSQSKHEESLEQEQEQELGYRHSVTYTNPKLEEIKEQTLEYSKGTE
eukprot:TRINITY_DN11509_c0_g1_i1.p1 TRINITY_DN11509_c0_g1~~TRINITY_DN11509_c0_g1_i1.p1  ORF type:complete len:381 (-),score=48.66 TRINITY_DN11509_c0_g1_i1:95-1237(-)